MRTLPHLAALAIVIASGAVHGIWTGRWSTSRELEDRVAALGRIPRTIGDWRGQALSLDRRTTEVGEIAGYLMRRYEDPRGDALTVLIVCGRPGPISVHTPEVCYPGAGFVASAPTSKRVIGSGPAGQPDEFWVAEFVKPGAVLPERLRILYAWNSDGIWKASAQPRLEFGASPALYKLYVVVDGAVADQPDRGDVGVEFLRKLLPELRQSLFSSR